ncbi:four helix bundle protein [Mangrovivirga sp. M17]|uniref:Four helix bundle protein n=1 Tax=Mangrovivirga halotolerans TaxID=2993936 RepID=A0ABT3RVA9_9BACT|nr:four helix bundle protein [Mangrovivirga halotolerans]MCX2745299.1 four helix bundle protein [Mangrovivirga halotolerans]
MFDFQKLTVYQKGKLFVQGIDELLEQNKFHRSVNDQLKRASLSIILNIAEGSSRFSLKEKKHYAVISRGSAFECVAVLEYLYDSGKIDKSKYDMHLSQLEELSRMLFAMIKRFDTNGKLMKK